MADIVEFEGLISSPGVVVSKEVLNPCSDAMTRAIVAEHRRRDTEESRRRFDKIGVLTPQIAASALSAEVAFDLSLRCQEGPVYEYWRLYKMQVGNFWDHVLLAREGVLAFCLTASPEVNLSRPPTVHTMRPEDVSYGFQVDTLAASLMDFVVRHRLSPWADGIQE